MLLDWFAFPNTNIEIVIGHSTERSDKVLFVSLCTVQSRVLVRPEDYQDCVLVSQVLEAAVVKEIRRLHDFVYC